MGRDRDRGTRNNRRSIFLLFYLLDFLPFSSSFDLSFSFKLCESRSRRTVWTRTDYDDDYDYDDGSDDDEDDYDDTAINLLIYPLKC